MSRRRYRSRSARRAPGFSPDVIEHPAGPGWKRDQHQAAAKTIEAEGLAPEPATLAVIPGIAEPLTWLPPLPETGVLDENGAQLVQIVCGRRTGVVVPGFPAVLNAQPNTPEEVEALRIVRLNWANAHCVRVASKQSGGRADLQLRPAKGAAEQCYGLLGLDVTLAWRYGAQAGLDVANQIRRATEFGAELLRRIYKVGVFGSLYHPANPYRINFCDDPEDAIGFGSHVQYYTVRALAGSWLTRERDYRRVGPATCAGLHMHRLGVDVHAHARARFLADLEWQFRAATEAEMRIRRMEKTKIEQTLAVRAAGDVVIAAEIDRQLRRWDASFQKAGKKMAEIYRRNVATASRNQRPVDWMLSKQVTLFAARELALDPVWAPFVARGQRAAKEIETDHWQCGFAKSLSRLLFEWEAKNRIAGGEMKELSVDRCGTPASAGEDDFVLDGYRSTFPDLVDALEEVAFLGQRSAHRGLVRKADGRPRDAVVAYLERMEKSGAAHSSVVREVFRRFDLAAVKTAAPPPATAPDVQCGTIETVPRPPSPVTSPL